MCGFVCACNSARPLYLEPNMVVLLGFEGKENVEFSY